MMVWACPIFDDVCRDKLGVGGGGGGRARASAGMGNTFNRGQSSGLLAGFNGGVKERATNFKGLNRSELG